MSKKNKQIKFPKAKVLYSKYRISQNQIDMQKYYNEFKRDGELKFNSDNQFGKVEYYDPKTTDEFFLCARKNAFNQTMLGNQADSETTLMKCDTIENFIRGDRLNHFIETTDLLNFLIETDVKDVTMLRDIFKLESPYVAKTKRLMSAGLTGSTNQWKMMNRQSISGVLYLPDRKNSIAYMLYLAEYDDPNDKRTTCRLFVDDSIFGTAYLCDDETTDDYFQQGSQIVEDYKIVYNFLMYMYCFPQGITDGVPKGATLDMSHSGRRFKVSLVDELKDVISEMKSSERAPHLRRGFFKTLRSEVFVNKKGSVIYVRPTFVKGRADTAIAV